MDERRLKKTLVIICVVFAVCTVVFCAFRYAGFDILEEIVPTGTEEDAGLVECSIDSITSPAGFLKIEGWACIPGEDIGWTDNQYILKRISDGKYFRISSAPVDRQDLKELFNAEYQDEVQYDRAGLRGKVKVARLDLKNQEYELYIEYGNNGRDIMKNTGVVINAGTLS